MSSSENPDPTEEVCTTLPADILNALDALVAAQPETASRDEAVRHILRQWLRAKGYMRDPDAAEGIRPQDLSSANDD
jgi:metal-responsive CopG/Arc/MetJ family transcriptional regulator